jgi:Zn finger protein HypA/HybF involved in hydrogenase expression
MEIKQVPKKQWFECCDCKLKLTHDDSADKTPVLEDMWLLVCPKCGSKEFTIVK